MDPITQILLTVGLNALVTGVIIFLFQKRIEGKAFQEQTRFKRFHEKRAETLEVLYQKFRIFSDQLNKLLESGFIETNEFEVNPDTLKAIVSNYSNSKEYFEDNKIFLDTKEVRDIDKIYTSFWYVQQVVKLLYLDPRNVTKSQIVRANSYIVSVPGLKSVDLEDPRYLELALDIYNVTIRLVEQVEKIYRKIH